MKVVRAGGGIKGLKGKEVCELENEQRAQNKGLKGKEDLRVC
jgi:hypothetical protein